MSTLPVAVAGNTKCVILFEPKDVDYCTACTVLCHSVDGSILDKDVSSEVPLATEESIDPYDVSVALMLGHGVIVEVSPKTMSGNCTGAISNNSTVADDSPILVHGLPTAESVDDVKSLVALNPAETGETGIIILEHAPKVVGEMSDSDVA